VLRAGLRPGPETEPRVISTHRAGSKCDRLSAYARLEIVNSPDLGHN
jgi:hypothetical protein